MGGLWGARVVRETIALEVDVSEFKQACELEVDGTP